MVTLSVIKADVGGFVGHSNTYPELVEMAANMLEQAKRRKLIIDYFATRCGDDLELIMTHDRGEENRQVHSLAWKIFKRTVEHAKKLKLYGAGQDILKTAFSGNLRGMGPGYAEMEFEERASEPMIVFMGDKMDAGGWNSPLYRIFADPSNTAGLIIDPSMHQGFIFEVHDIKKGKKVKLSCPEELYDLLALIGSPSRYVIKRVFRKDGLITAVTSTTKLSIIAGRYVGKDDPVMIVRCQKGLPAVGEALEPFAFPHLVAGWMRGSHHGPLMPCSIPQAHPTRFDGPPRVMALGFQIVKGRLLGPVDLFDDPAFDLTRRKANEIADYLRKHGVFEPHRLPSEELEYTTLPQVIERLKGRWKRI
jgi:fructose 1,6-bisphosphate aldolase/phosphatase